MSLDFIDVLRAYFHAKARRKVYVELPREDHEEGVCGLSRKAMCGTTDAAYNWEIERREMLTEAGFEPGSHTSCVYRPIPEGDMGI